MIKIRRHSFSRSPAFVVCYSLVFVFLFVAIRGVPVFAARFFFESENKSFSVGQPFEADLMLDAENQDINAVEGKIYLSDNLKIIGINDGESIVKLWVQRPAEKNGEVVFAGIMPGGYAGDLSPYWKGSRPGKVVKLILEANGHDLSKIGVKDGRVLLNDGNGAPARLSISDFKFFTS